MSKKKDKGIKVPKNVLGFKLSKGTRKDLRKILTLLESPEAKALAISAATATVAYLAEQMAERQGLLGRVASKASTLVQSHTQAQN